MLIAVFFADKFLPTKKDIETLKNSGFKGVMIDTSDKKSGNLFNYKSYLEIKNFLTVARNMNLLTGIAGSINESHINDIIKFLHIDHVVDKFPHQISSGEAQRASLARSLL